MRYLIILIIIITSVSIQAQEDTVRYKIINQRKVYETYTLSGPRVGGTVIENGPLTQEIKDEFYDGFNRFIVQLGWQQEYNFFTLSNGASGVAQIVGLIGGLEQELFLPSVSGVIGFRTGGGFEFGVGGNVSINGTGLVLAIGYNFEMEEVRFPVNFALVPSRDGLRATLLIGFSKTD